MNDISIMNIKATMAALGLALLPFACAALDKGNTFDINGIKYQVIEPSEPTYEEVMVCAPTTAGREYSLPIQEDGTIHIPPQVEYDGVMYTVSSIEDGTFLNEPRLAFISLPNSINSIGRENFSQCANLNTLDLSKVTLPTPLPVTDCPALRHLILPETQNTTMAESFLGNYNLVSLHLPENIGESASFFMCLGFISSLQTVYSMSTIPPRFDSGVDGIPDSNRPDQYWLLFGNTSLWANQPVIYVPEGCVETYKSSPSWNCYNDIREYNSSALKSTADKTTQSRFLIHDGKIVAADNSPVTVFDIYGRKAVNENLAPGLYIGVAGSHSERLLIRN